MGYVRAKVQNLHFEQPDLAGLEVKVTATSISEFFLIQQALGDELLTGRQTAQIWREHFVDHLIGWNLEDDDGQPVPATMEGLTAQDFAFDDAVVAAWIRSLTSVPTPLGAGSTGGPLSAVPPIPMEPLSESQAS